MVIFIRKTENYVSLIIEGFQTLGYKIVTKSVECAVCLNIFHILPFIIYFTLGMSSTLFVISAVAGNLKTVNKMYFIDLFF